MLVVLWIGAIGAVLWAWVAILITGRYPRAAFHDVVAVARWQLRVTAYAALLTTDRYPPFRLDRRSDLRPTDARSDVTPAPGTPS